MARRTWWKLGALLAAMMMFLTMLPVTALAAAPENQVIYVGNENVTSGGYWTTDSNGNVTAYTGEGTPTDNYIHYDAGDNTLTLHNATIKEEVPLNTSTYVVGAAIGVHNQNGAAELTITLEGTNTIAEVGKGIFVLSSSTGGATLTITGDGSLDASASQTGIWVQSNSGNATLTIRNAKVEATGTSRGVNVQSHASSTASLTVDGGSLTASGSPGILYDSSGSGTVPKTTALTISNSAIVDARGGGIGAGYIWNLSGVSPTGDSVGIVFGLDLSDSKAGTVYGNVTLPEDLTIGEGESLEIPNGASLTIPEGTTLTVSGGKLTGENIPNEGVVYEVTEIKLGNDSLSLEVGGTATLTATVLPDNATNKGVTWESSNTSVATVDTSGLVTAVGTGTATITVTTVDGCKTASCTVTVIAKTFGISASPASLDFGSVYTGYTQPAAQTVTVTNTGNQTVTLTLPTSACYEIGKLSATELEPNDTATFTVQPMPGLVVGTHAETLTISGSDGVSAAVSLSFSVSSRPYIPSTPSGPDWDDVTDDIADAVDGGRVVVDMDGETELPGEVLEALAGRDVTLVLEMGNDVSWEIWGGDVPEGMSFSDLDMSVEMGTDDIPVGVVDLVTGERGSVQVTLEHDGPFGFELTLVAPIGERNEGLFANLYGYDEGYRSLSYETSALVGEGGAARLRLDHASQWLVALDSRSHGLPFPDAAEGQWYSGPVRWAWLSGTMTGHGDGSGLFGTSEAVSRAQMATVLWRLAGEPAASAALPADCDGDAFYATAVSWALQSGAFSGYEGGAFGPSDPLTREQAAVVLWRLAGAPGAECDLAPFADAGGVSEFADGAVRWAVSEGVLSGTAEGLLEPGRAVTRAELAALLMRVEAAGR